MFTTPRLIVIALCAALNFSVGSIVYLVKLPIYLDSIGVILCALLLAPDRKAAFVCSLCAALTSTIITGVLINPFLPWFVGTDLAIVLVSTFLMARFAVGFRAHPISDEQSMAVGAEKQMADQHLATQSFRFARNVIICGVVTGVVAAIVSAPVVAYVFGGVTGSGSAFLVGIFLKTGQNLWNATLTSGLIADPIDKTLQVLIAALLFRATPADFIAMVRAPAPQGHS